MFEQFEVFMIPFNLYRTVRVFLPEDYHQNEKQYPVLYMHDGQNLFKDEDASYGTSWGIADFLSISGLDLIVVGIDCNQEGFKRLDEYGPWVSAAMPMVYPEIKETVGGEGKEYIDFIVQELKPMIDQKYRTKPDESSMAGSSMGGLISTYAACAYPEIFKRVAAVSPAYWFNQDEIENLISESDLAGVERFYLDIGTRESSDKEDCCRDVASSKTVYKLLKEKIEDCRFEIIMDAVHNETAWRDRVPQIFSYLYK